MKTAVEQEITRKGTQTWHRRGELSLKNRVGTVVDISIFSNTFDQNGDQTIRVLAEMMLPSIKNAAKTRPRRRWEKRAKRAL